MAKPPNVVPWSYSSLTAFETCPKRYKLTKLTKQIVEPQTEATLHGNAVHKALELHLNGDQHLPEKYAQYLPLVERVRQQPGKRLVEYKFGLTEDYRSTTFFGKDVWFRGVIDVGVVGDKTATLLDWKGLAIDTKIPTPSGWSTMGELKVGDEVFDRFGKVCRVIGKSQVHDRPCFKLTFDDTTEVVCDDQHLWLVGDEVVDTLTLRDTLLRHGRCYRAVPLTSPVELEASDLPIHPYVLGFWLGDGKHTSGEVCKPDDEIWDRVVALGYELGNSLSCDRRARTHTIKGIRGHLSKLGVLGNKHIPQVYLRGSVSQRVELLRGLMDADGNANPTRKQAVFTTCSKTLSDNVMELLCSLGQRPLQSRTTQRGFGKTVTAWPISFRPQNGLNPFHLTRKAERIADWGRGHSYRRLITSIEPVDRVPTQCIAVDSETRTYLCTDRFLVTHNTGKPKVDADQLKLFAAAGFANFPYLDKVKTGYVWLAHGKLDANTFTRDDVPGIWQEFTPRVIRMVTALEKDKFLPKPSGLCRAHCPVPRSLCEFSGKVG